MPIPENEMVAAMALNAGSDAQRLKERVAILESDVEELRVEVRRLKDRIEASENRETERFQ
jgi:outer membrane murein-binding lipoprotein Lpp